MLSPTLQWHRETGPSKKNRIFRVSPTRKRKLRKEKPQWRVIVQFGQTTYFFCAHKRGPARHAPAPASPSLCILHAGGVTSLARNRCLALCCLCFLGCPLNTYTLHRSKSKPTSLVMPSVLVPGISQLGRSYAQDQKYDVPLRRGVSLADSFCLWRQAQQLTPSSPGQRPGAWPN